MINTEVAFHSHQIEKLNIMLPAVPNVGDNIEIPEDAVRFYSGAFIDETIFKIISKEWVISGYKPNLYFKKLRIYVEKINNNK